MKKLFLMAIMIMTVALTFADSPLTSCEFYRRYSSVSIVNTAERATIITQPMMNYLANKANPIAARVAVINALGWETENTGNDVKYFNMLKKKYNVDTEDKLAEKVDAGTLITYAYLKAMSNYSDVWKAKQLAEKAIEKNTGKSLTINLIASVIQAQYYLEDDWSRVYRVVANVVNDSSLKKDIKQEAIDDIWNYIKEYAKY